MVAKLLFATMLTKHVSLWFRKEAKCEGNGERYYTK